MRSLSVFVTSILLISIFCGCSTTKYLKENEYLYKSSDITFSDSVEIPKEEKKLDNELVDLSKLQPNKKLLGIYPLKLWLYEIGDTGIDDYVSNRSALGKKFLFLNFDKLVNQIDALDSNSNFRRWLTTKAGEPPHLADTTAMAETAVRMENYLYNRGYFYPTVTYSVAYNEKKKKATVTYHVDVNTLYRMRNIYYDIPEKYLSLSISRMDSSGPLQPGKPFDVEYLKNERTRIANYLLDRGYYKFDKQYVYFEVDSASGKDSLDIYVRISPPAGDTMHHPYHFRNIYIYTNASRDYGNTALKLDTVAYRDKKSIYYIISSEEDYNPRSLAAEIFIDSGQTFNLSRLRQTIAAFSNTGIFKYLTVQNLEIDSEKLVRYLDVTIKLDPTKLQETTNEFNASTTSDYLLGTYANSNYYRKNLFNSLDKFRLGLSGGVETQFTLGSAFINTSELSFVTGLEFPRMFWPFGFKYSKSSYPKTNLNAKFNYINRIDYYTLLNTSLEWGTTWYEVDARKQFILLPVDINYVSVPRTSETFDSILHDNLLLLQSFQPQFIIGPNFTFIYNSQALGINYNDIYFRGTLEVDQKFSRIDADFRDYLNLSPHRHLVGRAAFGIAVPYRHDEVVPYVKQFFVGGANSIRAFPIRRLGPGGYINYDLNVADGLEPKQIDQSGDMKIELNVEYRFAITKYIEGALFCDAGNIWTLKEDIYRPFSQFHFSDFLSQIAVGPGAGIRLNFGYFILRLDGAYPLYDPALDGPASQYIKDLYGDLLPAKKVVWNLAIGYPF